MKLFALTIVAMTAMPSIVSAAEGDAVQRYIAGGFAAMDANADGSVDLAEFDRFMRARLANQAAAFDEAFKTFDVDGDGGISAEEAAVHSELDANFEAIDTDADGMLTKEELRAAAIAAMVRG